MVYLQVEGLSKSFGDRELFANISFGIEQGMRCAFVANNGTGKTTLLNILTGHEQQDSGTVVYRKDLRVGYLPQIPQFADNATVAEACFQSENEIVKAIQRYEALLEAQTQHQAVDNAFQQALSEMDRLNAWDFETNIRQILGKLDIHDWNKPVGELSGGQQKRLALANVLITEPDLLILDEPTNHLDLAMVEWLEEWLNHSKMTLIMVTHDRYFLDNVCNEIYEIDNHQLYHYKGNYQYYLEKRDERIANFNAETQRAKNLYRKELDWMRRQPQARGTKAQSRIDAFKEIEQRAKQRLVEKEIQLGVKATYIGSKIFEAQYVSKAYGDRVLLKDFYYNFSRYEKMGIVGKNGTGKSTFLKMLIGEVAPDSGRFDVGDTVRFAYYSQTGITFNEEMKVIDAVRAVAEDIDLGGGQRLTATQLLSRFLFSPSRQHDFIHLLSGGERRRLYLCTVLMSNPNFLVLDEPTNDLDLATLRVLEDYLIGFHGCVIVVSHDRCFMDKVVDHLLVFQGEGKIKDYPGNYTDYRAFEALTIEEERENEAKRNIEKKPKTERTHEKDSNKLSYKERRELEQLEKDLETLNAEKNEIETSLSSGTLQSDDIVKLSMRLSEINPLIDEKEFRWLELSERDN
ncbi:MAG: ABC-F family ATP-binding cassette domain-containing protein [Bacteroidales bacterium]|nr:ABC-F family ATP-binding cassette domain-containing protein [Bacteroidales bacterium]